MLGTDEGAFGLATQESGDQGKLEGGQQEPLTMKKEQPLAAGKPGPRGFVWV